MPRRTNRRRRNRTEDDSGMSSLGFIRFVLSIITTLLDAVIHISLPIAVIFVVSLYIKDNIAEIINLTDFQLITLVFPLAVVNLILRFMSERQLNYLTNLLNTLWPRPDNQLEQ